MRAARSVRRAEEDGGVEIAGSTSSESRTPNGHWRELPRTRHDEPYFRVETQLQMEVLTQVAVQDALIAIAPPPDTTWSSYENAATLRAGRIVIAAAALRGVLTYDEVDWYSRIISSRRASGLWLEGCDPPSTPVGSARPAIRGREANGKRKPRGPDAASVTTAARALGECLRAARAGLPENLGQYERDTLSRVLGFIGLDGREARHRYRSSEEPSRNRTASAQAKRRRRHRSAIQPAVELERRTLDRQVEEGVAEKISDAVYVSRGST
jgi:hypothetical protein